MPLGPAAITERYPVIAFIGLGANLGDPRRQLEKALARLAEAEEVEVQKVSTFYRSPPLGPPNQPDYVNAVAQVRTRLSPEELVRLLLQIERELGRTRGERWGPRLIDLDLLLYGEEEMTTSTLTLPHPEMAKRAFVLVPLAEVAPEAWHPSLRKNAAQLLAELKPAARAACIPLNGPDHPKAALRLTPQNQN